jgi:multisubunit Na+/H+ antiporter MnhB subunit
MRKFKSSTILIAVAALVLTTGFTPASARWGGGHIGWRNAAIAAGIGAGLALAAGAAYGGPYYSGYGNAGYGYPYGYGGYGYRGRCFSSPAHC